MKYIIFWTLCQWVEQPCTDNTKVDKFGRTYEVECKKDHGKWEDCRQLKKEFENLDSAILFYNEARLQAVPEPGFKIGGGLIVQDDIIYRGGQYLFANGKGATWTPFKEYKYQMKDVRIKAISK